MEQNFSIQTLSSAPKDELATMVAQNYDRLYEEVTKKLESLKEETDKPMKTNGQFQWTQGNPQTTKDIFKEKRIFELIRVMGYIVHQSEMYNSGIKEIGLTKFAPFTWCGYPISDWKEDIQTRINVLRYEEKREKLERAQKELSTYMSEEQKKLLGLQSIAESLKDI